MKGNMYMGRKKKEIMKSVEEHMREATSLEQIPLSVLMQKNEVICPICHKTLPVETKECTIDGMTYQVCKGCMGSRINIVQP